MNEWKGLLFVLAPLFGRTAQVGGKQQKTVR